MVASGAAISPRGWVTASATCERLVNDIRPGPSPAPRLRWAAAGFRRPGRLTPLDRRPATPQWRCAGGGLLGLRTPFRHNRLCLQEFFLYAGGGQTAAAHINCDGWTPQRCHSNAARSRRLARLIALQRLARASKHHGLPTQLPSCRPPKQFARAFYTRPFPKHARTRYGSLGPPVLPLQRGRRTTDLPPIGTLVGVEVKVPPTPRAAVGVTKRTCTSASSAATTRRPDHRQALASNFRRRESHRRPRHPQAAGSALAPQAP